KISQKKSVFHNEVLTRFDLYKSLFLTLPFQSVKHTGTILPFFSTHCEKGVNERLTPEDIIDSFFGQYEQYVQEEDRIDFLFRIVQYIERQVVLFDAVEDSASKSTTCRSIYCTILKRKSILSSSCTYCSYCPKKLSIISSGVKRSFTPFSQCVEKKGSMVPVCFTL